MKIAIENFGAIKKRIEIEPRPLTIFCGSNNTGKTYVLYVLNAHALWSLARLIAYRCRVSNVVVRTGILSRNDSTEGNGFRSCLLP